MYLSRGTISRGNTGLQERHKTFCNLSLPHPTMTTRKKVRDQAGGTDRSCWCQPHLWLSFVQTSTEQCNPRGLLFSIFPTLVCMSLKPGKQLASKTGWICSPVFQEEYYFCLCFWPGLILSARVFVQTQKYLSLSLVMILQVGRSNTWDLFPWQNVLC